MGNVCLEKYFFYEGSKMKQLMSAVLINIPMFFCGMAIGWVSPATLWLQSESIHHQKPLTDFEVSCIASIAYLTSIPSYFLMKMLSNQFGRKYTLIFVSLTAVIFWGIKLSSFKTWVLILARSIIGLLMGGVYAICSVYTREISSGTFERTSGYLVNWFFFSGILFSYIIGALLQYNTILWVSVSLPVFNLLIIWTLPESPSFLCERGKINEATQVLAWLVCRNEEDKQVKSKLQQILQQKKLNKDCKKIAVKDILKDKTFNVLKASVVITIARTMWVTPIVNFTWTIFEDTTSYPVWSLNEPTIVFGIVLLAGSILSKYFIGKFKRKLTLALAFLISGFSIWVIVYTYFAGMINFEIHNGIPITALSLSIFCESSILQPLSCCLEEELSPTKFYGIVRGTTMTVGSLVSFIQSIIFLQLEDPIRYLMLFIIGIICIITSLFVAIEVPNQNIEFSVIEEINGNFDMEIDTRNKFNLETIGQSSTKSNKNESEKLDEKTESQEINLETEMEKMYVEKAEELNINIDNNQKLETVVENLEKVETHLEKLENDTEVGRLQTQTVLFETINF